MASSIRVFPAVIAVSVGALAFKGVDFAYAVAQAQETETEETEDPISKAGAALIGDAGKAPEELAATGLDVNATAQCVPGVDYSSEAGISEQEIKVLRSLADRREELDAREDDIEIREQTAAAAEIRLDEQIAELKSLETRVADILGQMDAKRDERMEKLVKTYEAMKPKDAGRIFNAMNDEGVLIDLAKSMKPASLAAIMASMDSPRAELVTKRLAELAEPPADIAELERPAG